MVRHPGLPGVDVLVRVNGTALQEYQDPEVHDTGEEVTRYVQSTSEAIFDIQIAYDGKAQFEGASHLAFDCYVDSQWTRRPLRRLSSAKTFIIQGKELSPILVKPYCFGKLDLLSASRSDEQMQKDSERLKNLGSIKVVVAPTKETGVGSRRMCDETDIISSVHGKDAAKLSLDHFVDFSSPIPQKTTRYSVTRVVDDEKFAFTFFYRSRSALQSLGFIPRDLDAVELSQKPVSEMTPAEIERMQRFIRETMDRETTAAGARRKIKAEDLTPKKVKVGVNDDGIIEIPDDNDDED